MHINASKKGVNLVLVSLLVIVLVIVGIIIYTLLPQKPVEPYFQDSPETWIEEKDNIKTINVDKVTKGEGFLDSQGQQYITKDIGTVFSYHGFYKGQFFRREYTKDEKTIIKISNNMDPNDGIIEGFVIEKLKDNTPTLYVFLDEDWKKKVFETKVYFGRSFQNEQEFDFSQQTTSGIYMNEILDDITRFENNYATHLGGVWVGDLREDNNSTLIVFS
jgi:hypothetical protein